MKYQRLSKDTALALFIDHQTGLMSLVQDYTPIDFKRNLHALAATARYFELPTILSTSFEDGPNGPFIPEVRALLPHATSIARPGQINAWDNEDFVAAIKKSGKKQLIISGIVTDVCVAFPTLSALEEGYEVFVVTDVSGTTSKTVRDAALTRMSLAGAQLMNWFSIACELQRDWRHDVEGFGKLLSEHLPSYSYVMRSYQTHRQKD